MRRSLCAVFLVAGLVAAPAVHADEKAKVPPAGEEKSEPQAKISSEDRKVIQNMDLLALMDMLKDMDILEAAQQAAPEEKK